MLFLFAILHVEKPLFHYFEEYQNFVRGTRLFFLHVFLLPLTVQVVTRMDMLYKKALLKDFLTATEKHLCPTFFLIPLKAGCLVSEELYS